ncbi:hypothetical protein EIZ39_06225 [Ammoniphilus sp. CFH 90114]|nr:hypothetical protein EIZ39_06225 [Ammoniphilus sp. CFH 90114]
MWKQKIIGKVAEKMVHSVTTPPPIAEWNKDLSQARVALVTTAGVHLRSQPRFDVEAGDHSYRIIPDATTKEDLVISHTHYDRSDADQDINCVFPLDRLHELVESGTIGSTATHHFGLMGYIPKTELLIDETAPQVAQQLVEDGVDIVLLSPG